MHNHPAPAEMSDLGSAAAVDPVLGGFLEQMAASEPFAKGGDDDDFKMKVLMDFFQSVMSSPESAFYAGVPVRVDGQAVGSFCMFGPKKPSTWSDAEVVWLEKQALRAAHSLEKQLEMKRFQHAQQAMMAQMMQMQQQMMAGMMPPGGGMMMGGGMPAAPTPMNSPAAMTMPSAFSPMR